MATEVGPEPLQGCIYLTGYKAELITHNENLKLFHPRKKIVVANEMKLN